jgi:hypothetical protein
MDCNSLGTTGARRGPIQRPVGGPGRGAQGRRAQLPAHRANEEITLNMHSSAECAAQIPPSATALEDASLSGGGVSACRAQLKRFG